MRFRINAPDVMQEKIEDEVIVVHVQTGCYYSLLGGGAAIWAALLGGEDTEVIVDGIVATGAADRGVVSAAIAAFVDELVGERLLVADPQRVEVLPFPVPALLPFEAPSLQKFSDMQELLLLDPIHEVGPEGWPLKPGTGN